MDVRTKAFEEALASLHYLVHVDMVALASTVDERILDGLENGKAQKFEYTLELCWKAIKAALKSQEGIDEASPKKVVKAWYLAERISEEDYLMLLAAIDDRNKLSHVYDLQSFETIVARLPDYTAMMRRVADSLSPAAP